MAEQVRVESGAGYQLLLAAASVADPRWRLVFTGAPALAGQWQRHLGRSTVTQVAGLGRFGWVHLLGWAITHRAGRDRAGLLELVESTDPAVLHGVLLGAQRRHLVELLGADAGELVRQAADGSGAARAAFRRALRSGRTNLEVHRWLWAAPSADVHARCRELIARLPDQPPERDSTAMRKVLRQRGFDEALALVAPRLHYRPTPERVVLIASDAVAPVVIEIDLPDRTVIAHPPLRPLHQPKPAARLESLGTALGDEARMGILVLLRGASRTLPELCEQLGRPRTTLLHHLALLRGAGLIELAVPAHGPNVYRLDPAGFAELASLAGKFAADASGGRQTP